MPRDLPGLYWDNEKKRYFPLASRPAGEASKAKPLLTSPTPDANASKPETGHTRRQRSPNESSAVPPSKRHHSYAAAPALRKNAGHILNAFRESPFSVHRRKCIHEMQMHKLAIPKLHNKAVQIQFDGSVTALCAKSNEELLIGDDTGWLYSVEMKDPDGSMREFGLRTQITSITRSGPVSMVTSLGSPSRLLVMREDSMGLLILRELPPQVCSDVWCGQVWDRKAVVGGKQAAVVFTDLERDEYVRLHKSSDVLALCQQNEYITFMGMRNGIIDRWDSRQPSGKTDLIVNMSEKTSVQGDRMNRTAASIDYLRSVHGHELLVRTIRGDLETHDLRFLRSKVPLLQFHGHIPSYETKLGITVDAAEDFLFSGEGDACLRIWSIRTGELLSAGIKAPRKFPSDVRAEGAEAPLKYLIRAMEVVEDDSTVVLWLAVKNRLDRLILGPKGLLL